MTDPDDRAERALRAALQAHADEPDFRPLQLDPRPAPRQGWIRWSPVAAALVVLAAVAIPLILNQTTAGTGTVAAVPADARAERAPGGSPAADGSPHPAAGWRWESYRVLSYQVPTSWGYGWAPASDWCAGGDQPPYGAIVDVAPGPRGRPVRTILCPRTIPVDRLPMFVTVTAAGSTDRGWDLPAGWAVATTELDGFRVEVVHPEEEARVAADIVASVRPLGTIDPNGCSATGGALSRAELPVPDRLSLCQYDLGGNRQLLASKALSGDAAQRVIDALERAPAGSGPDDTSCRAVGNTDVIVRLWRGPAARDVRVSYSGCRDNGVTGLGPRRVLTRDACRAVLVPPLTFLTGFGTAGLLCAPDPAPTPAASVSPTPTR